MTTRHAQTGRARPVFLLPALLASSLILGCGGTQAASLPVTTLTINQQRVTAEVAATQATREHGLMGRKALPPGHGMLFVFDRAAPQCFWMKNTPLALSIAFITTQGMVLSIAKMQPYTKTVHCPPGPILYALEMRQGWFAGAHIKPGDMVDGLP
jgi:uncharacterized membrane protein (UPF0127 family)